MGQSTFEELEDLKNAQSKNDISALKVRLRELNIEIVDLEDQANPSTMRSLDEQLKQRLSEYSALEKSMPEKVEKPVGESPEQLAIAKEIEKNNQQLSGITRRGKDAVARLSSLKSDINTLASLKGSLTALDNETKERKEELRETCKRFYLDIDSIVSYKIDTNNIDSKLKESSTEVGKLEKESDEKFSNSTDFEKIFSIPDLRKAVQYLKEKIKVLQETVSAPRRRYQRYLQAHAEVTSKLEEIMGNNENPKPGTIKEIEQRILYIKNDLQDLLNKKHAARDDICRSIYQAKEQVRSFYESLKSSVENLLEEVSDKEFKVTIDASFVPKREFSKKFFELVNQTSKGPFRGTSEGQTELNERFNDVNWNSFDSVLSFVKNLVEDISKEDLSKQIKDSKEFYDLLFSFEYFHARYELRLGGKNLNQLSPGEKGLLLLVFLDYA
ncbi:hypothetical protein ACUNV4_30325 [Granulosicoccus sp. 3-233]|uniref:hypothetical protein n=1 Tax=Granulosicoccus sp. 3-233 TaxID=3417969 RepID=UPI003D33D040